MRSFIEDTGHAYPTLCPGLEHLARWLAEGEIPWAAPQDPFETFFVTGKRAFIDREPLRAGVKAVALGDVRVLKVCGERPCGKSWTWYYLTYLEDQLDGFNCAKVDFADYSRPPEPYDVMWSIASKLDLGQPPRDCSNVPSDQAMRLVEWFVGRVNQSEAGYLVALDSLDHRILSTATEDLLTGLAKAAVDSGSRRPLALLLLGSKVELPAASTQGVLEEIVTPPGREHVESFLSGLAQHCQADFPLPAVKASAEQAFDGLSNDPYEALNEMTARVQKFALDYFSGVTAR
jgi:hypothetical protein